MKPATIGAAIAAMLLFMLHEPLMSGDLSGALVGTAFVLAHGAVVLGLAALLMFLPGLRARVLAHRPDRKHVGQMLAGLIGTAVLVHGVIHGVGA